MAQSGRFLQQVLIFLANIQHLQDGYAWHCTVASYKEITNVLKFEGFTGSDSRTAVEFYSECFLDQKGITIMLI